MNETHYQDTTQHELYAGRTSLLNSTQVMQPPPAQNADPAREADWLDRFSQQQDKINNLKYKVSMLQQELRSEREQNEQTIENFTVLCQDLKFKGMDEVEDLQSEIATVREQMRAMASEKA